MKSQCLPLDVHLRVLLVFFSCTTLVIRDEASSWEERSQLGDIWIDEIGKVHVCRGRHAKEVLPCAAFAPSKGRRMHIHRQTTYTTNMAITTATNAAVVAGNGPHAKLASPSPPGAVVIRPGYAVLTSVPTSARNCPITFPLCQYSTQGTSPMSHAAGSHTLHREYSSELIAWHASSPR
jgi:hypothetical protein